MRGSLDRPGEPRVPDQPDPDGGWSRADLRQRLDRLPEGHPSSPHASDSARDQPLSLRVQELPAREKQAAAGSADTPAAGGPDNAPAGGRPDELDRRPEARSRDYWSEVPRFLQTWVEHERRWPAERAAPIDRSRDPAGSWRGDGNQYLSPEQNAQADDVIARVQRAEESVTADMKKVEQENACGGRLEGFDFRLKGQDRMKEKIAEKVESQPDRTAAEAVTGISDAIRYTFCFELTNFVGAYWDAKERLEAREYQMVYSENHWRDDPQYKGINTRWETSDGQRFEVQFHTSESYHAKQEVTHASYERIRNPLTSDDERGGLKAFQQDVSFWIAAPEGVETIPHYREKGR